MTYFVVTYYSTIKRKWLVASHISGQWKVKTNLYEARELKRELQRGNPQRKICIRALLSDGKIDWRFCG